MRPRCILVHSRINNKKNVFCSEKSDKMDDGTKEERPPHPRANANIFEILSFGWLYRIFKDGRKKDIEINDLYKTLDDDQSLPLVNELEKKWILELDNCKKTNRQPSLIKVLIKLFGDKLILGGILTIILDDILSICQPFFLGQVIAHFNSSTPSNRSSNLGLFYGISLVLCSFVRKWYASWIDVFTKHVGMRIRVSVCSLIYNKSLRLSCSALGKTSVGKVVNLITNDVNQFDSITLSLISVWNGPLKTIVVTYFLWQEIGVASIFGVGIIFMFIPLQGWLGKKSSEFRFKTAVKTDERLRLMNEIISGIQVIKMFTWEKPFANLLKDTRKKEVKYIAKSSLMRATLFSFLIFHTRTALFFSVFLFVSLGNNINAQKVYVVSSYFTLLFAPMTIFLPRAIANLAETLTSIKRIQEFLFYEEKDEAKIVMDYKLGTHDAITSTVVDNNFALGDFNNQNCNKELNEASIKISNASAKWTDDQTENTLNHINLTIEPGRLVAVIGPVGAGKSSLLHVILRELALFEGNLTVNGVVSYAPQEPWLFSSSVQQNILFGSPMDKERYNNVIRVCELNTDFKQFPHGDRTIVGERGISLSGGQKARVNLARAIYKQADIYLLDDPLSAVDACVGKHLYEKCIKGYLKEKTCIIITHQFQHLTNVDKIVLIENGTISAKGTYQELQASGLDFTKLLGPAAETETVSNEQSCTENESNNYLDVPVVKNRKGSIQSVSSAIEGSEHNDDQSKPVEVAETHSSGNISFSVYSSYFTAGKNGIMLSFLIFICIITEVFVASGDYWISVWVNLEEHVFNNQIEVLKNSTLKDNDILINALRAWPISRHTCLIIFAVLTFSMVATALIRSVSLVSVCMNASIHLHNNMFDAITKATMHFFNTNSSGRLLNRFSKDIGIIDDRLLVTLVDCIHIGLSVVAVIVIIGFVNIYLTITTLIIGILFYKIRLFCLPYMRNIRRLEGVTKSPVIAHLNASLQGLTTLRAFNAEQILSNEFGIHQDLHSSAWYLNFTSNRAFSLWLDAVSIIYLAIVLFSFFVIDSHVYGGYVGLAITQAISMTSSLQWGMRQFAELENQMISVERVLEYTNTPQEALKSSLDKKLPKKWPSDGRISFKNFYLRYSLDAPCVLKNLTFNIDSKQKIGIVGRTGAGKSSLISALFRLALNEGYIYIDGIEIHELGLHELRSKISIIPQEPILFSGTMRKNLDPFDEYPDHVLWNALDEVELKEVVENLPGGLHSKMSEGGSNFSVGQRQLICLARAIVRNNSILILDEATANVDPQTDELIQNTIRNKFQMCTVLTIAHRLNTVMDSDKVLVIDEGTVVEFDHSWNLLKNNNGYFYKMVEQTGQDTADSLHKIANESYQTIQVSKNL